MIAGNFIGVDATGQIGQGNAGSGIRVVQSTDNTIGGDLDADRNVISGNLLNGVELINSANNNTIAGNYIGTNVDGTTEIANDIGVGVFLQSSNNTIGGTADGAENLISGNTQAGVLMFGVDVKNNVVVGNLIGVDATGSSAIGNGNGVQLGGDARENFVGGSEIGSRNVISGNDFAGIRMDGQETKFNTVQRNYIGTNLDGDAAIPNEIGIFLNDNFFNVIGGFGGGLGNVISGNASDGLQLINNTNDVEIEGNLIGTAADGISPLPNGGRGIFLGSGTRLTQIGLVTGFNGVFQNTTGANVIAFNGAEGIALDADAGNNNTFDSNEIFGNQRLGADLFENTSPRSGITANDVKDVDTGANDLQNRVILNSAQLTGDSLEITGTFNAQADTLFKITFFSNEPGFGINEGQSFFRSTIVETDANGNVSFTRTFDDVQVPVGHSITALIEGNNGSGTSEFSDRVFIKNANDDPFVIIRDSGAIEGDANNSQAVFTVELLEASQNTITVDYATVDGSATSGADFQATSGTLTFQAGVLTQEFTVDVLGDTIDESLETFTVSLTGTTGATIFDDSAIGYIIDNDNDGGDLPTGATDSDLSEFMLGTAHVTVVAIESDGTADPDTERFTPVQLDEIRQGVIDGLAFWEEALDNQGSVHSIDFDIDFTHLDTPIQSPFEPIAGPGVTGFPDYDWIDSFLDTVGANTAASDIDDLEAFSHLQRLEHDTNWAFTVFVVNNSMDADQLFNDGTVAFAKLGGPFAVVPASNTAVTTAHETGHIFFNLDEFPGGNNFTERSGYYNTQNLNAFDSNPNPGSRVLSIMSDIDDQDDAFAARAISPTGAEMLGWLDSDQDGIFDVLDVDHTLTGAGDYTADTGIYRFVGDSNVNALENLNPRGNGNDITINKITRAQFRIDGGDWIDSASFDATQTVVDISFAAPPNVPIEVRTIDERSGVTSNVFSDESTADVLGVEFADASVSEGESVDIIIRRTAEDITQPLTVNLAGDDDSEMQFPDSVTILGGQSTVTISINAEDDNIIDGAQDVTLTASAADFVAGSDSIDVTDNDVAGFTIAIEGNDTEVTEAGSTDTFTVVLTAQPDTNVVIGVESRDTGEATVNTQSLAFNANNWDQPQTVTVTGADDNIDDGNQVTAVSLSIEENLTDDNFDNVADQFLQVTTIDDDTAGFVIAETNNATIVSENGTTDIFTVVLTAEPIEPVVIEIDNPDTGEIDVDPIRLTFDSNNWDNLQQVTVLGIDDLINDGDETTTIRLSINDDDSDNAFDNVDDQTLVATTLDNDTPGFVVSETNNSTIVSEDGNSDTNSVVLEVAPLSDVVIEVSSNDEGEVTVDKTLLTFTTQNWNAPQNITVTGQDGNWARR